MEDFKFKKDAIAWLKGELSDQVFKPQKKNAALSGIDINATEVISSVQLVNHNFNNILKLTGEWGKVIGNPALPFRMMIYGMPGSGKSTGSISFASYLAKQHNLRILYIAAEENKGYTLAEKLKRLQAAHPNLYVANKFPDNLKLYDFIFIDSVNQMKLTPEMLDKLFQLSGKSFVYVFQVTKDGIFKGNQEFEHDVDVVLTTILKDGHATINTKKSRFGGSGSLSIF